MPEITLQDLGLTKEDIAEKVIDRIVERMLMKTGYDEDGNIIRSSGETAFATTMKAAVIERVNKAVEDIAAKNVLPNVATYVENLTMQETNRWGDKTKQAMTFREYLVQRAEAWITEQVNYDGKAKGQDSYNWTAAQTRIAHMIHQHLQYNIKNAIDKALGELNSNIAKGLTETVQIKLAEAMAGLKTTVTMKG